MDDLNLGLSILIWLLTVTCFLVIGASGSSASGLPSSEQVDRPFTVVRLAHLADPSCTVLWHTQLPALRQIEAAGEKGLKVADLTTGYACSARLYPELYEGTGFAAWLRFLDKAGLVAVHGTMVAITAEGERWLKYLEETEKVQLGRARQGQYER